MLGLGLVLLLAGAAAAALAPKAREVGIIAALAGAVLIVLNYVPAIG